MEQMHSKIAGIETGFLAALRNDKGWEFQFFRAVGRMFEPKAKGQKPRAKCSKHGQAATDWKLAAQVL